MQVLNGGTKRDIIEELRKLLTMAEEGELLCVGMVWARPLEGGRSEFNNTWATDETYNHSFVSLVAALEVMKHELITGVLQDE